MKSYSDLVVGKPEFLQFHARSKGRSNMFYLAVRQGQLWKEVPATNQSFRVRNSQYEKQHCIFIYFTKDNKEMNSTFFIDLALARALPMVKTGFLERTAAE